MLQIDLRTLEIGRHEFNLESNADELGIEPGLMDQIRADVQLHYDGKEAVVMVDASAVARLTCDRTLVEFDQPLRGQYSVLFSPDEPDEDADEEVRPFSSTDQEIDITDIVRDTLLLAIPIRKLAPGAEETPIRTQFGVGEGAEDNPVDPRWEALAALKQNGENGGHPGQE